VGEAVRVEVAGWPIGIVEVSLCGNNATRGSQDCAVSLARTITATPASPPKSSLTSSKIITGKGFTLLTITRPPVGCPCVIRAVHREASLLATAPFTVRGLGKTAKTTVEEAAPAAAVRRLSVLTTAVRNESGPTSPATWAGWAGIRAERVLELTVQNTGTVALTDPAWSLAVGRDGAAPAVVPTPALGRLEPGEQRTVRVPITVAAPVVGSYLVTGSIDGLDSPVPVRVELTSWPWAIPALVALLAIALARPPRKLRKPGQARRERRRRSQIDPSSNSPAATDTATKVLS
jgi:hypothetical protein